MRSNWLDLASEGDEGVASGVLQDAAVTEAHDTALDFEPEGAIHVRDSKATFR